MTSNTFLIWRKIIVLPLVSILLFLPLAAQVKVKSEDYIQGKLDGERDAKGNPAWIAGGMLCGLFAVIYCLIESPSPPSAALVGKSPDYVLGYTDAYRSKTRARNATYAALGWAVWVCIYLVIISSGGETTY